MSYTNLAPYLRPGYPSARESDTGVGNVYLYRGPTATLNTEKPGGAGETWADTRPVREIVLVPVGAAASGISELTVITSTKAGYSGSIGTAAVEETYYALNWRPVTKALETNPAFQTGGAYALDATARKCIVGWRAEQDPALRTAYKFRQLDSEGNPGDEVDIATASANALVYIKLVERGVEEYVDYLPVWRRRRIYQGSNPPTASTIGQYDGSVPSLPSDIDTAYFFVKSADNVERIGTSSRWRRDEEWEGAVQVFCDRDSVFPSGDPTAP